MSITWQPPTHRTTARVDYRTLGKGTGCHNLIQTATCFQSTSEGQNSVISRTCPWITDLNTLNSSLSSLQLVKKQQGTHEASSEDIYTMIYIYTVYDAHLLLYASSRLAGAFLHTSFLHLVLSLQGSLLWTFSQWVLLLLGSWFFFFFLNKTKNIRLKKSKLLVLSVTSRGSYFWKLGSLPIAFTQTSPQKDSNSAGKVEKVLNRSYRPALRCIVCLFASKWNQHLNKQKKRTYEEQADTLHHLCYSLSLFRTVFIH